MQGGSSKMMYSSIMNKIFTLPNDCKVYPAHDNKVRWTTRCCTKFAIFFRIDKIFYLCILLLTGTYLAERLYNSGEPRRFF